MSAGTEPTIPVPRKRRGILNKIEDLLSQAMLTLDINCKSCTSCGVSRRVNREEAQAHDQLKAMREKVRRLAQSKICKE